MVLKFVELIKKKKKKKKIEFGPFLRSYERKTEIRYFLNRLSKKISKFTRTSFLMGVLKNVQK